MSNCLCEAKFCRQKNEGEEKQIRRAFSKRNKRNYGQCRPRNNEKAIVQNENIQRYVSVKVPVKIAKFQIPANMNIEILRLHEDYLIFTWMLPNSLLLLVAPYFKTDRTNVKRRTKCFSEEVGHVCEEERSHTVSLQKVINEILLRAAIDRFLRARCRSTNHFPLSLALLLLRQIKH